MGWFEEDRGAEKLLIGDGPLDLAHTMMLRIAKEYKRDARRRPTPAELARTLEVAIAAAKDELFAQMDDKEVKSVVIKFGGEKRRTRAVAGDLYAVPLATQGYAHIRIEDVFRDDDILIGVLSAVSNTIASPESLRGVPILDERLTDTIAIEKGLWRRLRTSTTPAPRSKRSAKDTNSEQERQMRRLGRNWISTQLGSDLVTALRERGLLNP